MADEKIAKETEKADSEAVKKLENEIKKAFQENRYEDVKKIAGMLKSADPQNHLADHLVGKAEKAISEQARKSNELRIKNLEGMMKDAYKDGQLMEIAKIAGEMKKIDPENKVMKKIETKIEKAKAILDAQVRKEKIKALEIQIKDNIKNNRTDETVKKANDLLKLDLKNSIALNILKRIARERKTDLESLITIKPVQAVKTPEIKKDEKNNAEGIKKIKLEQKIDKNVKPVTDTDKTEKKPSFFSRIFKKKEMTENREKADVTAEKKSVLSAPQKTEKDKMKELENNLKLALKGKNESKVKEAAWEIRKIEPENKAAINALKKIEEDRKNSEKKAKEEKIKASEKEIKVFLKNNESDKVAEKANELLKDDPRNKTAAKALKEIENLKKKSIAVPAAVLKTEQKQGFFNRLTDLLPKKGKKIDQRAKTAETKFEVVSGVKPAEAKTAPQNEIAREVKIAVTPAVPAEPVNIAQPVKPSANENSENKITPSSFLSPKPSIIKPVIPAKPPVTTFKNASQIFPEKTEKAEMPSPVMPTAVPSEPKTENVPEKGNIFTKLFGKKEEAEKPAGSIIETIVAQADKTKKQSEITKKEETDTGESFLKFSNLFLKFSVVFILIISAFFYIFNIDENNTVLTLFSIENNAITLKNSADKLNDLEKQKDGINKEIDKYKKGYENEYQNTIDSIVKNRLDWPNLIKELNQVTESVYEKNALAKYVQYNNYTYDAASGRLGVSATLSDPLGKNLTKLAELEDAFAILYLLPVQYSQCDLQRLNHLTIAFYL